MLTTSDKSNPRLTSAIKYAEMGWYVFPVHFVTTKNECSCGHSNCNSVGKHPISLSGLNDATTDIERITQWWRKQPYANVGIRTGEISGIDVIDIDERSGGKETWADLEREYGPIDSTPMATTGGGGTHIYIEYTGRLHSQNETLQGIDVKSDGGYVLAEPSNHVMGSYEWELILEPFDTPVINLSVTNDKLYSYIVESQNERVPTTPELKEVPRVISEGSRNSKLTSVAGGLRRRGLNSDEISLLLHQYNQRFCDPPLDATEIERISQSMERYEPEPPPPSTIDPEIGVTANAPLLASGLPLTDAGNRDRLVARYGKQILYVPEEGWKLWSGVCWEKDQTNRVTEMALDTARVIRAEEQTGVVDKQGVDKAEKWSYASEALPKIKAMTTLAESHPSIVSSVNDLDKHLYLFNAANTTLDLIEQEAIDPDPTHRLTQVSRMKYNPEATCPYWEEFLSQILPDKKVVRHLQKYLGLSLTGDMTAEAIFILFGDGANGKSLLLEALAYLMGDYLSNAPAHTFLSSSRNESIRNDLAMLRSSRLVTVSETNKGSTLDESVIKRTVSGDLETARFLHKEFFQFRPKYKILLATNNKPEISGATHGTWRRLHLIEFGVKFGTPGHPVAGKKDEIIAKLKSESSGVLNWMIKGFQMYREEGLIQPDAVDNATRSYREEQDPLLEFISSSCVVDDILSISVTDLREAYNAYTGEDQSSVWFGRAMSEHGYKASRVGSARMRVYKGISLNEESQELLLQRNQRGFN
tara:strand:- start:2215 stop:4488 length:2274 start_codon:yes stop_codon:yes gene_type:complete